MSMSDLQFLQIQVDALFTHDSRGRIRYVNEPGGDLAPRFFFGRTREGHIWRCRYDLTEETVRKLEGLVSKEPVDGNPRTEPRNMDAFLTVLRADQEIQSIDAGPAYQFPDGLPLPANVRHITRSDLHLLRTRSGIWRKPRGSSRDASHAWR